MSFFEKKSILFFIPIVVIGVLSFGVDKSRACTDTPHFGVSSLTIGVGEQKNIKVTNGGDRAWTDLPFVGAAMVGVNEVAIVGAKEGKAKVTVCREATNCESLNVTVTKKVVQAAPKTVKAVKKVATVRKPVKAKPVIKISTTSAAPKVTAATDGLVLSQTNVRMMEKESVDITVQDVSAVSVSSDSSVISTAISGNPTLHNVKVTVYGLKSGIANLKVCGQNLLCTIVQVTVLPTLQVAATPATQVVVTTAAQTTPTTQTVQTTQTTQTTQPDGSLPNFSVAGNWVPNKYLNIPVGTTYWLRTTITSNLTAASNIWLVPIQVRENYVGITVSPYYYGEAIVTVCNGPLTSTNCDLVHVNFKK